MPHAAAIPLAMLVGTLRYIAALPWGNAGGTPAICCRIGRGLRAVEPLRCIAAPPRGVGSGTPSIWCRTLLWPWAVVLLWYAAAPLGRSGQWHSCNWLLHGFGAVGGGSCAVLCNTAWDWWATELMQSTTAVQFLQYFASMLGGSGHGSPSLHYLTAWELCICFSALPRCWGGQWVVGPLQWSATMTRGTRQWDSCGCCCTAFW